jgi:hypothetical protein
VHGSGVRAIRKPVRNGFGSVIKNLFANAERRPRAASLR